MTDDDLLTMASQLGTALQARGWRVACAESCTGGWVAKVLTDIPGSSGWFERGFIVYSDAAKHELLDVALTTLENHGAVSEQTARELALGALARSPADLAIAITGIAGPGGGSAAKPVGLVWFGWARRNGAVRVAHEQFAGDRTAVRRQAVLYALQGALQALIDA